MRATIDDSFAELSRALPPDLRIHAVGLPFRLGLTRRPDGGWEDFVRMDPNRDLPRYGPAGCPGAPSGPICGRTTTALYTA
jgi:hypothetical protein